MSEKTQALYLVPTLEFYKKAFLTSNDPAHFAVAAAFEAAINRLNELEKQRTSDQFLYEGLQKSNDAFVEKVKKLEKTISNLWDRNNELTAQLEEAYSSQSDDEK